MAISVLSQPQFHSEEAAFAFLEGVLWPEGPVCPHCGALGRISKIKANVEKRVRIGLHKCGDCSKQFTVKVGTVFEHARIPLHKMLQAVHLLCSSKKGISSHQLHRILGIQYKSAWFLSHRIREAMRDGSLAPLGGAGGVVEIDETYLGKMDGVPRKGIKGGRSGYRNAVLTLVERGGSARSFHIDGARTSSILPIVNANVARETALMTDQASWYPEIAIEFASHETVNHSREEYVRGPVHTNTVEGYYSIFKRGMKGVYQHCGEKHLHRYLAEFDFRYSQRVALGVDDAARAQKALKGVAGKRLKYRVEACS
jgi:transposase-like protein